MPTRGSRALARTAMDARVPQAGYSSTIMQPAHLPSLGLNTLYGQPSPGLHGTHDLVHMEFARRHSEADVLGTQGIPSPLFTPNHQSALAMCQSHPERPIFSLAPSSQSLCARFTEAVQGQSSGSEGDYFPDQSPTPSGSQEDCSMSVVSVTSPEPFSIAEPDATDIPSQAANHPPPHKDISPPSPWLASSRPHGDGKNLRIPGAARGLKDPKHARTSKRHKDAVDPRAARRLERQRKTDEENINILWNLFVPKGETQGLKKNRLEMSMSRR